MTGTTHYRYSISARFQAFALAFTDFDIFRFIAAKSFVISFAGKITICERLKTVLFDVFLCCCGLFVFALHSCPLLIHLDNVTISYQTFFFFFTSCAFRASLDSINVFTFNSERSRKIVLICFLPSFFFAFCDYHETY